MKKVSVCLLFLILVKASAGQVTEVPEFSKLKKMKAHFMTLSRPQVFVFLSPECPLCINYSGVLNKLWLRYKDSVDLYGIVPGRNYSDVSVNEFITEYKIEFPLHRDPKYHLTNFLRATVTPEAVLVNTAGEIAYKGAIDDWAYAEGKVKPFTSMHYLEDAIIAVTGDRKPEISVTRAVGCFIE